MDTTGRLTLTNGSGGAATIDITLPGGTTPADGNTIGAFPKSQLTPNLLTSTVHARGEARVNLEVTPQRIVDAAVITEDMSLPIDAGQTLVDKLEAGQPTNPNYATGPLTAYVAQQAGLDRMQFTQLGTGLEDVVNVMSNGLNDSLIAKIPFIGDIDLSQTFIGDLRRLAQDLIDKLTHPGATSVQIQRAIQGVIFNSVGPGGVDLITLDPLHHDDVNVDDADEVADLRDVDVTFDLVNQEFAVNLEISGFADLGDRLRSGAGCADL